MGENLRRVVFLRLRCLGDDKRLLALIYNPTNQSRVALGGEGGFEGKGCLSVFISNFVWYQPFGRHYIWELFFFMEKNMAFLVTSLGSKNWRSTDLLELRLWAEAKDLVVSWIIELPGVTFVVRASWGYLHLVPGGCFTLFGSLC